LLIHSIRAAGAAVASRRRDLQGPPRGRPSATQMWRVLAPRRLLRTTAEMAEEEEALSGDDGHSETGMRLRGRGSGAHWPVVEAIPAGAVPVLRQAGQGAARIDEPVRDVLTKCWPSGFAPRGAHRSGLGRVRASRQLVDSSRHSQAGSDDRKCLELVGGIGKYRRAGPRAYHGTVR